MGFHLVDRVYKYVRGTSPKAQAVLAYLAHRADDAGARKCFPNTDTIEESTHFGRTAVRDALNELREANLLLWKSGGRHKGTGGRALANEYTFNLPVNKSSKSRGRHTACAGAATRPVQGPPDGLCIGRQTASINQDQKEWYHSSVSGETEAESADSKKEFVELGESWKQRKERAQERIELGKRTLTALVEEAMKVAGVSDFRNRQIFTSTMLRRHPDSCLEVILRFQSECRANEGKMLANPAAALNSELSALPAVI